MSVLPFPSDPVAAIEREQRHVRLRKYGRGHGYEVETLEGQWVKAPGVTSCLGSLAKPGLQYWAANLQFDADILTAYQLLEEMTHAGLGTVSLPSLESYTDAFRSIAPKKKKHVEALREACDIGKGVHRLIESDLRVRMGLEPLDTSSVLEDARFAFAGFGEWAESVNLRPLMVEAVLCSRAKVVAGTMDFLALVLVNDRPTLLDTKTSKSIYQSHKLQLTAYRKMFCEMSGLLPDGALVRVPKDGREIELVTMDDSKDKPDELWDVFLHLRAIHPWAKATGLIK